MKRSLYIILAFIIAVSSASVAQAAVSIMKNTKHDLSSGSTASIRSSVGSGTDQICAFCHTPHSSRKDAPLWNRTDVSGPYTIYTSDVLTGLTYPSPDQPTTRTSPVDVHVKTRICLSCHDGTIALGNLVNLPFQLSMDVRMQGANLTADYKLDRPAAGYIGLDLSDDHPVAVKHVSGSAAGNDPELRGTIGGTGVRLYSSDTGNKTNDGTVGAYVECTSCHNAHDNKYGNFLVSPNDGSKVCLDCHTKNIGAIAGSAHDNATTVGYNPPTGATASPSTYGTYVSEIKCMTCHFPHKAGVTDTSQLPAGNPNAAPSTYGKYLLSFQEDMSCFNNPNRWKSPDPVNVCHGTGGVGTGGKNIDIQTQMNKSNSGHSAYRSGSFNSYSGKHAATEQGASGNAKYGTIVTHVVCSDCHNAHTAGNVSPAHTPGTNTINTDSSLYGAAGVKLVGSVTAWNAPLQTNYDAFEPLGATSSQTWPLPHYEYEICLKCHSSFAWGASPTGPSIFDLTGISNMTDQAKEFNPANTSYHTVIGARNAGSFSPPAASWTDPSKFNANSLMYCSDCHGNDTSVGQPQGPHGSTNSGILVLPFSDTYGTQVNLGGAIQQSSGDLCFKCHAYSVYGSGTTNGVPSAGNTGFAGGGVNMHTQHAWRQAAQANTSTPNVISYKCVNCHTRVAHGWQRRALVVVASDGVPYEAGTTGSGKITVVPTFNTGAYVKADCSTVNGCHQ